MTSYPFSMPTARPARYATPSPSFSPRTSTSMWPSSSATRPATAAVPPGLLSSTTRMSASGIAARVRRSISSMFGASSYVGVITRTRTDSSYGGGRARRRFADASLIEPERPAVLADDAEVLLEHAGGGRRARLRGVIRLVPVVPDAGQDHEVRAAEVVCEARATGVGHARVHLDVARAGRVLGEEVIQPRLARHRSA